MTAATIMIQGTASSVGKSLIATALCRLYRRRGYRVAPFKAQNMALNSAVTWEGHEIGRAQAAQAEACGLRASSLMNPVLLKPESDRRSQVIVRGKSWGSMQATEYHEVKPRLRSLILESLEELRSNHDLVVIEGAGSPAEINLKQNDLVNMFVATSIKSPVLLVGDIDRGGVFAALMGTLLLLEPHEKDLICGFLINKFRGDPALLKSGLDFLEEKTGKPVIGVVPFMRDHRLAEEDSLSLDAVPRVWARGPEQKPRVAVIRLPRISNFDEFGPLLRSTDMETIFVDDPKLIDAATLVIVPGSKNTLEDLDWLKSSGFAEAILQRHRKGLSNKLNHWLLGICGGCQMLGELIDDSSGVETEGRQGYGLGLLGVQTRFHPEKRTVQCQVEPRAGLGSEEDSPLVRPAWLIDALGAFPLKGYEIHAGQTFVKTTQDGRGGQTGFFHLQTLSPTLVERHGDGVASPCGQVMGTMVHGLFENPGVAAALGRWLVRSGDHGAASSDLVLKPDLEPSVLDKAWDVYDGLADHLEQHLNIPLLDAVLFGKGPIGVRP